MKLQLVLYFVLNSMVTMSDTQEALFDCAFPDKQDNCGFLNDITEPAKWKLNSGPTPSRNTGPEQDHTDGTGFYMYAEATGYGEGDMARIYTQKISGTANACTKIKFYAHTYGEDVGTLNLYILADKPYYFQTPIWDKSQESSSKWTEHEVTLLVSFDYSIAFEARFRRPSVTDNRGDIAIDDITVTPSNSCGISSCDDAVVCLNGGTCIATNGVGEDFDFVCECASGWSGDHCENDFDECSSSPCLNGTCYHDLDNFECSCYLGYYGETCEYIDMCISEDLERCQNGATCNRVENDFNCTCAPGFDGKVCDVNINDCSPNPCQNGGICTDGIDDYECACRTDYFGKSCQYMAGECDFEEETLTSCGYVSELYYLDWVVNSGRTPIPSIGPEQDHTTGDGFYTYAEVDTNEDENDERAIARLVTPPFPSTTIGRCTTITFWYYMQGSNIGTLNIYLRSQGNTRQEPIFTLTGDQGAEWKQGTLSISSSVQYQVVFDSVSKSLIVGAQDNYIGLDDIRVAPDTCDYDYCSEGPCKNGGICYSDATGYTCECVGTWAGKDCTEDRDECTEPTPPCQNGGACTDKNPGFECKCTSSYVGSVCEYIKGSCDFDDQTLLLCEYTNEDLTDGFKWLRNKGPTPSTATGPQVDHTLGTEDGYYLYVEATDREEFSFARIASPVVPNSGAQCTGLDFWYHMNGRNIGELALYIQFENEFPISPIWSLTGEQGNSWNMVELNISAPNDFRMVFEAIVLPQSNLEPDNRGDIAIDDIVVHFDRNCGYDICFTQPCENGGTCIAVNENDYRCDCKDGYDGKDCENFPACTPNPCLNEGLCLPDSDGSEQCLCKEGWLGDYCEIKDTCLPNPCNNGGTCTRYQDVAFQCECAPGYTGNTCATDIDDCASFPCQNGGNCLDLVDSYDCQCIENYIGATCREIPGGCDFQNDLCEWTMPNPELVWQRYSGPGPNFPTSGPRSDHTYGNSSGFYIFTEVYRDQPPAGSKYQFRSQVFSKSAVQTGKILTLEFYYHMYGPGIGKLNVYVLDDALQSQSQWTKLKGQDRTDWRRFAEIVEPKTDFSIMIEHEVDSTLLYLADLAVDDISLVISDGVIVGDTTTKSDGTSSMQTWSSQHTTCANCIDNTNPVDGGLSGGAIAGIVIGVVAAVLLSVGGIWFYRERKYQRFGKSVGMEIQNIYTAET